MKEFIRHGTAAFRRGNLALFAAGVAMTLAGTAIGRDRAAASPINTIAKDGVMTEFYNGWQCIGCGKIDVDRPCLGICQDRPVRVVIAEDYERVLERNKRLESIVLRLARARPHADAWEKSFRTLQAEAIDISRS